MSKALAQGVRALEQGEVPVGAVIVENSSGNILASTHNLVESTNDATCHAEILAIKAASKKLSSKNLSSCDIYITLEPCTMCASAISHAKIARVFYGASDIKGGAVENGVRFFTRETCHHRPEVYPGIMAKESTDLLLEFFKNLRQG
ncbi:MAG: nucleoside deaminase [Rickettsiaceae bacterium]|nr:nucleoside deaminase [Rickettsiaceae bacterium]